MQDAQDPYEFEEDVMGKKVQTRNMEIGSKGNIEQASPPDIARTMRSIRVQLQNYKVDNEKLLKSQEEQNQLNTSILQSLTDNKNKLYLGHNSNSDNKNKTIPKSHSHGIFHDLKRTSLDKTYNPSS